MLRNLLIVFCAITSVVCSNAETMTLDKVIYEINEDYASVVGLKGISYKFSSSSPYYNFGCYDEYIIKSEITYNNEVYKVKEIKSLDIEIKTEYPVGGFLDNSHVKIEIPEGIEEIPDGLFYNADIVIHRTGGITSKLNYFTKCWYGLSVNLPSTIKKIGKEAFSSIELTSLSLPENIEEIGENAFANCTMRWAETSLSLKLPSSLKYLGEGAFMNCNFIEDLTLSNSLTEISPYTFSGCSNIKSVSIPRSVEKIGANAFSGCTSASSLSLPAWLAEIDNQAFENCSSILEVVLPERLTTLGNFVFSGCTSLNKCSFPNSLNNIGSGAFYNCSSLSEAILPASLKELMDDTFNGCANLSVVQLPSTIQSIGNSTFSGCSSLKSIELPSTITSIGKMAFQGCSALSSLVLPNSVNSLGDAAFSQCSSLKDVTLSNELLIIPSEAFRYCTSMQNLIIGIKTEEIKDLSFDGCKSLETIVSLNPQPPMATSNSFDELAYDNAVLNVPSVSKDLYSNAPVWKYFAKQDVIIEWAKSISITPNQIIGFANDSGTLKISAFPEIGKYENLVWSSSDSDIVSVDAAGHYILGNKVGEAIITATVYVGEDHQTQLQAEVDVTVNVTPVSKISLTPSEKTIEIGETFYIMAEVLPKNATYNEVIWGSSNSEIATVDKDGHITAVGIGKTTIIAKSANYPDVFAECQIEVTDIPITSITLNKSSIEMSVGTSYQLTATIEPDNVINKDLEWVSLDAAIVSVDQSGLITALEKGEAVIQVRSKSTPSVYAECHITVNERIIEGESITINSDTFTAVIGEEFDIAVNVLPENATNKNVNWFSGDTSIAFVNENGHVYAIGVGETFIRATLESNPDIYADCMVVVKPQSIAVSKINLDPNNCNLEFGEQRQLTATVLPADATDKTIVWHSENPNVATVDESGLVKAVNVGETSIIVSSKSDSEIYAVCNIVVEKTNLSWDQDIRCEVGETIELTATTTNDLPIEYTSSGNTGGYHEATIFENDGHVYASFPEEGAYVLKAMCGTQVIEKKFNVVSSHNGLMEIDGIYYRYTDYQEQALTVVRGYEMYDGDYFIPATINNMPVVSIDNFAFYQCHNLNNVVIENGIMTCGTQAFGAGSLHSISIPASIRSLGSGKYIFNVLMVNLNTIYLHEQTPPEADETTFNGYVSYDECELHVPAGTLHAYKVAPIWKEFAHIIDDLPNNGENISVRIFGGDRTILKGQTVQLKALVIPDALTNEVVWISNASSIANVDDHGYLRGVSPGDAEIYAYVGKVFGVIKVKVDDYTTIENITEKVESCFTIEGGTLKLHELPHNSRILVYGSDGLLVHYVINPPTDLNLELNGKGIYIICINGNTFKIRL